MKIAIVGAGFGGLAAAYDLRRAGHDVEIFEASDHAGGLASGLKQPQWDWSVEHFYHHWFASDRHMLKLLKELGLKEKVLFIKPKTVVYHDGDFSPLDSPLSALTFPGFNIFDIARFGFVTVFLRYLANWKKLESITADSWLRKAYGKRLYGTLFEPLLVGKFGPFYQDVNMAWFWARIKARTTRLGTFEGGFQAFVDAFVEKLKEMGVNFHFSMPVQAILPNADKQLDILLPNEEKHFDRCLVTIAPGMLAKMAYTLPEDYLQGLLNLKSMGAVVMVLSIKQKLSKKGYYWFNIPKSAGFPFLAVVEHTNFVSAKNFGNEHIIYCGDYREKDHEYFDLSKEELLNRFLPAMTRINPDFKPEWVNESWLFRTRYAQPVPLINHSQNIPSIRTPLSGLYFASMSQVYPWDRGTNFAVEIGRKAAKMMIKDEKAES